MVGNKKSLPTRQEIETSLAPLASLAFANKSKINLQRQSGCKINFERKEGRKITGIPRGPQSLSTRQLDRMVGFKNTLLALYKIWDSPRVLTESFFCSLFFMLVLCLLYGTPGSTWGYSHSTPSGLLNHIFYRYMNDLRSTKFA